MFKQSFKTFFLTFFFLRYFGYAQYKFQRNKKSRQKNASTRLLTLARLFADPTHRSNKIYFKYEHTMLKIKVADFCLNFQKERSRSSNEKK
jgi:hypothetical protein